MFVLLAAGMIAGTPNEVTRKSLSFSELGSELFTNWAVPFEVASLVLLVALIGAIVISRESEQ